jgi:hypothetical protein
MVLESSFRVGCAPPSFHPFLCPPPCHPAPCHMLSPRQGLRHLASTWEYLCSVGLDRPHSWRCRSRFFRFPQIRGYLDLPAQLPPSCCCSFAPPFLPIPTRLPGPPILQPAYDTATATTLPYLSDYPYLPGMTGLCGLCGSASLRIPCLQWPGQPSYAPQCCPCVLTLNVFRSGDVSSTMRARTLSCGGTPSEMYQVAGLRSTSSKLVRFPITTSRVLCV